MPPTDGAGAASATPRPMPSGCRSNAGSSPRRSSEIPILTPSTPGSSNAVSRGPRRSRWARCAPWRETCSRSGGLLLPLTTSNVGSTLAPRPRIADDREHDTASGAHVSAPPSPYDRIEEDSMKGLLATIIGVAIVAFANPGVAYVVEVATSIPATSAEDDAQLKHAVESAIDDVLHHASGFVPTVVTVQNARVDRKSTRLNSSHSQISYAVFCLKKKKNTKQEKN